MLPVLTMAAMLLSSATDLAKLVISTPQPRESMTLYFQNRRETESFELVDGSRAVRPDEIKALSHFLRCWRTNRERLMNARTVEIVSQVAAHFGVDRIEVVSGYRARPYGAPHSRHFLARAMDIHVPGVKAKRVATWIWQNFRHVGVGYYPKQDFVHVDSREEDVRWVDTSSHGESAEALYSPRKPTEELPENAPRLAFDAPPPAAAPALDLKLALAVQ
jgi:uncharacterized protein YcbK (DUF882 family)